MDGQFYTQNQLKLFAEDLPKVFLDAGFELIEQPYIDHSLCGFRATYLRRYLLSQPLPSFNEGILTTLVHTVGLPFGQNGQRMVVLSSPRDLKNEPICESLKLKIRFNEEGLPQVVITDQQRQSSDPDSSGSRIPQGHPKSFNDGQELEQIQHDIALHRRFFGFETSHQYYNQDLYRSLSNYVSHIIEAISPGLIQLPFEIKLEILKKLSVESIIKMSQVNNEFRRLIFKKGESLWRHLCARDFNLRMINRKVHTSWMELYRDTYMTTQIEICRKERALPGLPERLALPPAPYRYPIGWMPEILQLPFYPIEAEILALPQNPLRLALEFHPLRRGSSLDSLQGI